MVQTGMATPYATQYPQNGEAGPPKTEPGKEGPPVAVPPFSPPTVTPNGIEQQTVSIVSISCSFPVLLCVPQHSVHGVQTLELSSAMLSLSLARQSGRTCENVSISARAYRSLYCRYLQCWGRKYLSIRVC